MARLLQCLRSSTMFKKRDQPLASTYKDSTVIHDTWPCERSSPGGAPKIGGLARIVVPAPTAWSLDLGSYYGSGVHCIDSRSDKIITPPSPPLHTKHTRVMKVSMWRKRATPQGQASKASTGRGGKGGWIGSGLSEDPRLRSWGRGS